MAVSRFLELFLGRRDTLTMEDREAIRAIPVRRASYPSGSTIIGGGPTPDESCLVVAGMALRVHRFGEAERVVSAVHVPGDFVDLHAFLLARLDHNVVAQGPVTVEFIAHDRLTAITEAHPHLTRLFWLSTLIDAKVHRQWILAGARLQAHEHVGHLLCELHARLAAVGLVKDDTYPFPFQQKELADVLGYSPAHINRAIQFLRERNLLKLGPDTVTLPNMGKLRELARFEPSYLDLDQQPR